MSLERVRDLVARLRAELSRPQHLREAPDARPWTADAATGRELFESMLLARHLDTAAHELRARGVGHYTICSSGHEANGVVGRLTGPEDPALLHYRSGAFQLERARQVPELDPVLDITRSLVASAHEPTSGGRHKVFGRKELGIVPQTSTIASHLPRAVGTALALERKARLRGEAARSLVVASLGDASLNHSTAQGALNSACWSVAQRLRVPLLVVCEDNGLGISVRTPSGWVERRLRSFGDFAYFSAHGWDVEETLGAAREAVRLCREQRRPAFLHLRCARLLGHAGSDVDTVYRSQDELRQVADRDPVLHLARALVLGRAATAEELLALDASLEERVRVASARAIEDPRLTERGAIMASLARPWKLGERRAGAEPLGAGTSSSSAEKPRGELLSLAQGLTQALNELMERDPGALLFGEDVAKKGGVYGVTKGLQGRFGPARVFNTLLDEQSIFGLALGAANQGLLPLPEIQYLAYVHNAIDQLRGEAATLPFFSNGAFDNPMIVRIASLGYQKGFGGHFHNDNSLAALREIPGVVLVVPARGDDALELLRTAHQLAREERRVVVVLEPIALYHQRELFTAGDDRWLARDTGREAETGRVRVYGEAPGEVTVATFGNGLFLSLRAAAELAREGLRVRVVDLRWLAPLPYDELFALARETGRLLFVDECRKTGSTSEAVAAELLDRGEPLHFARVTAADSFIPLGDAARLVLPDEAEICRAARALAAR